MKTRLSDFVPGSRELAHTSSRWTGEDAAYYNYPFLLTNRFIHTYAHTPAQPPCSCVDDPHLDDRGLWQDMLSAMDLCRISASSAGGGGGVGRDFCICDDFVDAVFVVALPPFGRLGKRGTLRRDL